MTAAFLLASLVLAVTPGPGVVYIVARSVAQGRRAGLASVAGVALGNLGNALAAALGLAALFAVSAAAFGAVRWAGAAYLLWLGVAALRAPRAAAAAHAPIEPLRAGRLVRDGFVVALLNPKTALFFAAFLPQFIDSAAPPLARTVGFGAAFVLIAAATDIAYVVVAAAVAPRLAGRHGPARFGRVASAAVFIGLGLAAAVDAWRAGR